jgi:hypothetical protein
MKEKVQNFVKKHETTIGSCINVLWIFMLLSIGAKIEDCILAGNLDRISNENYKILASDGKAFIKLVKSYK